METIHHAFPPNEQASLLDVLRLCGLQPEITDGVVTAPKTLNGQVIGTQYFVPAKALLTMKEAPDDFLRWQENLLARDFYKDRSHELYVYLVGFPEVIQELQQSGYAYVVASDCNYAPKYVLSVTDLPQALAPLFEGVPDYSSKGTLPYTAIRRERPVVEEGDLRTQVKIGPFATYSEELQNLIDHRRGSPEHAQVERIYSRIMNRQLPDGYASNGESMAVVFSHALHQAHKTLHEPFTLIAHGMIHAFDDLKRIEALLVLREFQAATGCNLVFATPRNDLAAIAKRILTRSSKLVELRAG